MKLYFAPGACSLSPHIVLHEAGIAAETEKVDLASKKTASGADFASINPKGYVPALQLDDGTLLTEGPAIVQYLADQRPASKLAPENGTLPRYQLQSLLNFISTEIHKSYSPLFRPTTVPEARQVAIDNLQKRYDTVEEMLANRQYITGEQFTVADAYLFTVTNWSRVVKVDLFSTRPNLVAYMERVGGRPAVQSAMRAEGLIK
ncbi:glutathione transferase GstA [Solimonas sp. K1W22B-7]|uniref:glutathione transferase GstA n=1 Tax=Solimonas sp. K1W22B-7 TaxID=2303331 RepID=UPI000E3328A0|nr:glutathione transferase GstA [Solimonas sp. K1W22B-7]AXQ29949.1 glutathione transferase GstA [Solimonas sp. K1W22B-7]